MPLSDFVRYLNAQLPFSPAGRRSATPFVSENGRVFVYFDRVRLESYFSPIVDTANGDLRGHAARLEATGKDGRQVLEPAVVFALPKDDEEFIFLDRLVRTLHTLNYLVYRDRSAQGLLVLKVHPRHVASVTADHGLAFEEVLRACGLLPEQITLQIEIDGRANSAHLHRAISNYRSRGYGIAISLSGQRVIRGDGGSDLALLREIRPAIIKLDPPWFTPLEALRPLIDPLHGIDAKVLVEGLNAGSSRSEAWGHGIDLLQAYASPHRLLHADDNSSRAAA